MGHTVAPTLSSSLLAAVVILVILIGVTSCCCRGQLCRHWQLQLSLSSSLVLVAVGLAVVSVVVHWRRQLLSHWGRHWVRWQLWQFMTCQCYSPHLISMSFLEVRTRSELGSTLRSGPLRPGPRTCKFGSGPPWHRTEPRTCGFGSVRCRWEKGFSWVSPELTFFGLFQLFIGSVVNNAIIQKSD